MKVFLIFITLFILNICSLWSQEIPSDLSLEDPEDIKLLMEEFPDDDSQRQSKSRSDSILDDLEALKDDLGEIEFTLPDSELTGVEKDEELESVSRPKILSGEEDSSSAKLVFDVGKEERELLELAKTMRGKIPTEEWSEIAGSTLKSSYTVQKNDWLWKISQKLFGSGFYYSKIWALNPYITNPHLIEPGMILTFDTGSQDSIPEIGVIEKEDKEVVGLMKKDDPMAQWGDDATPQWILDKEDLKNQGVYIQYSTVQTTNDLKKVSSQSLIKEYESYEPPRPDFQIDVPRDEYDATGFDKSSRVSFKFKEGFYLNTFISTNVVQDFGKIEAAIDEKQLFTKFDTVYVAFDDSIDVVIGDKFSVYVAQGKKSHRNSDREGF